MPDSVIAILKSNEITHYSAQLLKEQSGKVVKVGGRIISLFVPDELGIETLDTAHDYMNDLGAYLLLDDGLGIISVSIFTESLNQLRRVKDNLIGSIVVVEGTYFPLLQTTEFVFKDGTKKKIENQSKDDETPIVLAHLTYLTTEQVE